jgi:hypothetical protein
MAFRSKQAADGEADTVTKAKHKMPPGTLPTVACPKVPGSSCKSFRLTGTKSEFWFDGRPSVYYFSETATNLLIERLFYAVSVPTFIIHQRVKLVFQ